MNLSKKEIFFLKSQSGRGRSGMKRKQHFFVVVLLSFFFLHCRRRRPKGVAAPIFILFYSSTRGRRRFDCPLDLISDIFACQNKRIFSLKIKVRKFCWRKSF